MAWSALGDSTGMLHAARGGQSDATSNSLQVNSPSCTYFIKACSNDSECQGTNTFGHLYISIKNHISFT